MTKERDGRIHSGGPALSLWHRFPAVPGCLHLAPPPLLLPVFTPVLVPVRTKLLFNRAFGAFLGVVLCPVFCALFHSWLPVIRRRALGQADAILRAAVGQVGVADRPCGLGRVLAAVVMLRRLLAGVRLAAVVRVPVAFLGRSILG